MHIIAYKGKNESSTYNLNLLYNKGKIFIMDNHLAASWCWLKKINTNKSYHLLHIDRHYDLLNGQLGLWIESLKSENIDLKKIQIEKLLEIKYSYGRIGTAQTFRWDNYMPILMNLYPHLIGELLLATHNDGTYPSEFSPTYIPEYSLLETISSIGKSNNRWILNLDIDYFFSDYNNKKIQLLSDEFIIAIAREIKKNYSKIDVITVALSPELCGGWDKSIKATQLFLSTFKINLEKILIRN